METVVQTEFHLPNVMSISLQLNKIAITLASYTNLLVPLAVSLSLSNTRVDYLHSTEHQIKYFS